MIKVEFESVCAKMYIFLNDVIVRKVYTIRLVNMSNLNVHMKGNKAIGALYDVSKKHQFPQEHLFKNENLKSVKKQLRRKMVQPQSKDKALLTGTGKHTYKD